MLNNLFQAITKKKKLIEEEADCIYQNYKGHQSDEIAKISNE